MLQYTVTHTPKLGLAESASSKASTSSHSTHPPTPACSIFLETYPFRITMVFLTAKDHDPLPTSDILSWLFENPAYKIDKAVLVDAADASRSISHSQARTMVRKSIDGLRHFGLEPGDCVCIHAFNDIEYIVLALTTIAAGGVWAGTNPAYTQLELRHHLKTTASKFIISEPELFSQILPAAKSLGMPESSIKVFHPLPKRTCKENFTSYRSLLNHEESDWIHFSSPD